MCGAVRYRVADKFEYAAYCHCSACRQATGSAFKPFAGIPREHFEITKGKKHVTQYGGEAYDGRCAICGSFLFSVVREGKWVHITMGTLIDAPSIRPDHHIFVGSKAPWHEITDALPQHEGHVNSM